MATKGIVKGIVSNLVTVEVDGPVSQNEICYISVGGVKLMAEVIKVIGKNAFVQVFESTRGMRVGDEAEFEGHMLEVTLGPGMLSRNYDGLQNDLDKMEGVFLRRGEYTFPLDNDKLWDFKPLAKVGDKVAAGGWLGEVDENFQPHKIMVPFTFKGEYTVKSLKEAGLENMDGVVVAMGNNLEASAMTIITAKELGVPYILAKSNNDEAAKILSKIGADKVIYPEKDAGINVARKLLCSNFLEFFEISDDINVAEISVRPEWVGKTLKELDFRRSYNMNIILAKEDGRSIDHITPELQLKESYRLLVTISNEGLKRMMQ